MQLAELGTYEECLLKAQSSIEDKSALKQFNKLIVSQNGVIDKTGYPELSDSASIIRNIYSDKSGYIKYIETENVGKAALILGAGRVKKEDEIDFGAGIILCKKLFDKVEKGEKIATLFTNNENKFKEASILINNSIEFSQIRIFRPQMIYKIIN